MMGDWGLPDMGLPDNELNLTFTASQDEQLMREARQLGLLQNFDGINGPEYDQKVYQQIEEQKYRPANYIPQQSRSIIEKEEFSGQFNFDIILSVDERDKNWAYSKSLHKVYITMEHTLPVRFSWHPPESHLWVRGRMIYKTDQHRSQPVRRCYNHEAMNNTSNMNISEQQIKHVMRCLDRASSYFEEEGGHLSVLTPLGVPQVGMDNVPMDYRFFCKNSCTSGMNRRPTEIIFTLENAESVVLGRKKVEVRICSCPKRDKEKEEGEFDHNTRGTGKKRKMTVASVPAGKKVMITSTNDTKIYDVNLKVVGKDNYNAVCKYAHDVMAGAASRSGNLEIYKPHMEDALAKSQSK